MTTSRSIPASLPTSADLDRVRNENEPRQVRADEAKRLKDQVFAFMNHTLENGHGANGTMLASEMRAYDKAEKLYDELDDIHNRNVTVRPSHAGWATGEGHEAPAYAKEAPLARNQSFAGYVRARGMVDPEDEGLNFGKFLAGITRGDWSGAERERVSNLSEGTGSNGGFLVPSVLSGNLIDLARNKTRVIEAGATIVPMESRTVTVPKWTGDPVSAWHSENATITPSDPTLGTVTLTAQSWACNVEASWELIEDAINGLESELMDMFAAQLALKLDLAALYGTGTPPEPLGVKNSSAVTKTPLATNGAALTSYDPVIDSVGRLQDANEEPTGIIYAPRTARALAKLKDTTNQPLTPPVFLDPYPRYATRQVPTNLVVGTSGSTTSDIFVGDWRQLLVGIRHQLEIKVLKERYADQGATGFIAWFRGDIQVARGAAFDVTTGVL